MAFIGEWPDVYQLFSLGAVLVLAPTKSTD